jgi:hypothetical protein
MTIQNPENPAIRKRSPYLKMSDRISLLSVDEAREEEGVPDEEDGGIVANDVPVALLRVELDGETPGAKIEANIAIILNIYFQVKNYFIGLALWVHQSS